MASLSERMKGIDAKNLLNLCKTFLGKKWEDVTEETFLMTVLTQGYGNRLFVCEIKGGSEKVLIRYYGGNVLPKDAPIRTQTETTEVLTFYSLGARGFGPKLLGTFDGGRIEEFIPSRNLQISELNDPDVSQALARSMAKFHLIDDLPISRQPWDVLKILKDFYKIFKETYPDVKNGEKHLLQAEINFDMEGETEWIEKTLPKIKTRVVFCHNDMNRSNVLVKLDPDKKMSWDQRLVPVDYEFSGYNYRGCDIGNHFCMRHFDFGAQDFMTGLPYPDEEERRVFVSAYVEYMKINHNYDDFDPDGLDSVDHILLEAEFGSLMARIINIVWTLRDLDFWAKMIEKKMKENKKDPEEKDDNFADFYNERKKEFLKRYPEYA